MSLVVSTSLSFKKDGLQLLAHPKRPRHHNLRLPRHSARLFIWSEISNSCMCSCPDADRKSADYTSAPTSRLVTKWMAALALCMRFFFGLLFLDGIRRSHGVVEDGSLDLEVFYLTYKQIHAWSQVEMSVRRRSKERCELHGNSERVWVGLSKLGPV